MLKRSTFRIFRRTGSRTEYQDAERARTALRAGHAVMLDAVNASPEGRRALEAVARDCGVPFTGIWLDAPEAVLTARTAARRDDASDATPAVVMKQLKQGPGSLTWHRLDAADSPESVAAAARRLLAL